MFPSVPRLLVLLGAVMASQLASCGLAEGADNPPPAVSCVQVQTEARPRNYAYDHLVTLRNGCKKAVTCAVKTDANPQPIAVELEVGEEKTVLTFTGSPARELRADVRCHERSG